jgi:hypothetical protein
MEERIFYVYGHIRMDTEESRVFYIGMGRKERAHSNRSRNPHWHNIYNINKENKAPLRVVTFADNLTFEEACKKEIELIAWYGREDLGKGLLINLTDGGEGTKNIIVTKEKALRCSRGISKALKEKYSKEQHHSKGIKFNEARLKQHTEIMREAMKSRKCDYSKMSGNNSNLTKGNISQYLKSTGELIDTFGSLGEAARATGIHSGRISAVVLGKRNQSKGFVFKRESPTVETDRAKNQNMVNINP